MDVQFEKPRNKHIHPFGGRCLNKIMGWYTKDEPSCIPSWIGSASKNTTRDLGCPILYPCAVVEGPVGFRNLRISMELVYLPSLKLTGCPEKRMVGIRLFPLGVAYVWAQTVSFREGTYQKLGKILGEGLPKIPVSSRVWVPVCFCFSRITGSLGHPNHSYIGIMAHFLRLRWVLVSLRTDTPNHYSLTTWQCMPIRVWTIICARV